MRRITLQIFILLFSSLSMISHCNGQNTDSTTSRHFSVFGGVALFNHVNGGLFYKGNDFNDKNGYYGKILSLPMITFTLGVKYKNISQLINYATKSTDGFYHNDFGSDHIKVKYIGYQVWYGFLKKKKIIIKPLIAVNLAYVEKTYEFSTMIEWGGDNTNSRKFKDDSKTILVQMPVGIYIDHKNLFLSLTYNLPVFSWISGSFQEKKTSQSFNQPLYSKSISGNFSGNSSDSDYEKQKNIFSLRFGYFINF